MRNAVVGGIIAAVVAVLVWAGVHNLRARRVADAQAKSQQMSIGVDKAGATATADSPLAADMRGKQAAVFTLTSSTGKRVSLADLKGKPVLLNFWATWCTPCKVEMPWFEEFQKKYAAQGLEVVGINEDEDAKSPEMQATIKKVLGQTGVDYTILMSDKKVGDAYGGLDVLPATFFIDRNGKIVAQAIGLAPKEDAEANIQKIVAGS
ncbi:TlpA family protein disulfide reductase [Terriglobus roseus]|uniref:Thiol-disulfide isomerase or thioredoxin n=1 Tax=Terriglobus roseus TaxID=392734 RepID=A0A1H4L386_9BACT|nr:TlpA disulfide reductase family protein [Terriglobus roseus]SEB64858.1 Thiol-disulfide isomerase or thioredoxin [Terriglobus roseus]